MTYINVPKVEAEATPSSSSGSWTKYVIDHTALQAASMAKDVEIFSLPAKTVIESLVLRPATAFAGTATYTLSVGVTGALTKYVGLTDAKTALLSLPPASFVAGPESFTSPTSIRLSAASTVLNLSSSSAGVAEVYVKTSVLP